MKITSLKLINFRNFSELDINLSDYKNIIIGDNGEGKTNIVEAIFVLALTKSFRTNDDNVLIKEKNNLYKIEGNINSTFVNNYKVIYQDNNKIVKINNKKVSKFSDYISNINVVLFSINDLKLIKDTPSTRRKLINLEISQVYKDYVKYLNYYNKILKQRNTYLKKVSIVENVNYDYLSILDSQLISFGIKIKEIRENFVKDINELISDIYFKLGGNDKLLIKYKCDYQDITNNELINIYKNNLKKDIFLGSTYFGVHKDDFIFCFNDKEIKEFASEGQQKNSIIAFKLSELEVFYNKTKEYPILILDDLFSELDLNKIKNIFNYISDDIQTFITTTDLNNLEKDYLKNSKIFKIKNGEIEEELYEWIYREWYSSIRRLRGC